MLIGHEQVGRSFVIALLGFLGPPAEQFLALGHGLVGAQGDILVAHDAAGGVFRVPHQAGDPLGIFRIELGKHLAALLDGQLRGDVGGFVVRHFLHDLADL